MASFIPVSDNIDVSNKLWDNAYMSSSNTMQSSVRVIHNNNVKETLSNFTLGGATSIDLPQNVLLTSTIITMKFRGNASDLPVLASLQSGWGYRAIRYVEWTFANSQPLRYTGEALYIKNLADCESGEKRKSQLNIAGEAWAGGASSVRPAAGVSASVNIYLPFSNLSASRNIPFDASILDRPVNVRIEFVRPEELFTYSATNAAAVIPLLPKSYADSYLTQSTSLFVDGFSDSIRNEVGRGGMGKYSYGFIYPQVFVSGDIKQGVAASQNSKVSFRLDNFLNGSLQSMDLYLERVSLADDASATLQGNVPYNKTQYYPMSNIELSYAGNVIYRADDKVSKLINLSQYTVDGDADTTGYVLSNITMPATGFVPVSTQSSWTHIQFSQFNETFFSNLIQSGVLLVANQVMITFNTPELDELVTINGGTPQATQPWYRLHANYNYQACIRTANGATEQLFNPPLRLIGSQVNTL